MEARQNTEALLLMQDGAIKAQQQAEWQLTSKRKRADRAESRLEQENRRIKELERALREAQNPRYHPSN